MRSMRGMCVAERRGALLLLVAALAWTVAPAQQVYKSVDADGHVVYSDRGANKSATTTPLHVEEADASGAAQLAKEQRALEAADAARRKEQSADDKARAAAAKQRQQACDKARQEYNRVLNTRRLYHLDASGNQVYYPDEQLDQVRDQARKSMLAACS